MGVMRISLGVAATIAVAASLTGCATTGGSEGGAQKTTVTAAWDVDPTTFDPAKVTGLDDFNAVRMFFDTVVRRDADNQLVSGIAETWEASADGAELKIRDGLTCADGTAIDAEVVANSLSRLADSETGSATAGLIFGGVDAATVTSDKAANTVTIKLAKPYSEMLTGLSHPAAGIVCPAGLKDLDGLASGTVEGAFSGPYVLEDAKKGVSYTLASRKDYDAWPDFKEPLEGRVPEKIVYSVSGDRSTNANQLSTQDLDLAAISTPDFQRFDGKDEFNSQLIKVDDLFVLFNQAEGHPFADPALRKAVAQLINREAFNNAVTSGLGEIEYTIADAETQCAVPDKSRVSAEDEAAAKKALAGVNVHLVTSLNHGPNGAGGTYLQERLRAAGANVEFENLDNGAWITKILGADDSTWDMTIYGSVNSAGTIWTGLSRTMGPWVGEGGRNPARTDNEAGMAAVQEAFAADTTEARCAAYDRAQASALERVDAVPLISAPVVYVSQEDVVFRAPNGRQDFSTIRIVD